MLVFGPSRWISEDFWLRIVLEGDGDDKLKVPKQAGS